MNQPDYSAFALTEEQRELIYTRVIHPQYFVHTKDQLEEPIAIITGGQPGSGKSVLRQAAEQVLAERGGAVVSDPDEMRRFHPMYLQLNAEDDKTTASKVQADASAFANRLFLDAISERRNIILDRTLGSPSQLSKFTDELLKAGYEGRIEAMAVRSEVSTVRVYFRYENEREKYGHGRFTPIDVHDKAYAGMPKSIERAQELGLVKSIRLYDQNALKIYDNHQTGAKGWSHSERAVDVLTFERLRPLKRADWETLAEQARFVGDRRNFRNAGVAERQEANDLAKLVERIGAAQGFKLGQPTTSAYQAGKRQAVQITQDLNNPVASDSARSKGKSR